MNGSDYPIESDNLEEQAKSLAAFLTLSIDNSIFKGIMRPDMVRSKIRNLQKLYEAVGEECPVSPKDVTKKNFLDFAYLSKKLALGI